MFQVGRANSYLHILFCQTSALPANKICGDGPLFLVCLHIGKFGVCTVTRLDDGRTASEASRCVRMISTTEFMEHLCRVLRRARVIALRIE